jgi:ribosomal protein S18 acetylase RimI-like enzyme
LVNEKYKKVVDDYIKPILEEVEGYDNQTIYIPNVCINRELRGKRIGTNLLGYFISQMEKAGYNQFALDCLLHNLPAKNLYHSMGFKEMKLFNGFSGDNRTIDVVNFFRKKGNYLPEEFQR